MIFIHTEFFGFFFGLFWFFEWFRVRIKVRILIYGVFRVFVLIFLIFRAEAYTCWSARFARSGLVVLRVYLMKFRFFSDFGIFLHFSSIFWVILVNFGFLSCKKTVFGHFIRFRHVQ